MKLNIVPARTGLTWVQLGIKTFLRQPLAMAGQFFMFMAVVSLLSVVPLLGTAIALALVPAATLGLMAASREAHAGRFPMPVTLISAFRAGPERMRAMLMLGAAYAGALLLVVLLGSLLGAGGPPPASQADQMTPEALRAAFDVSSLWPILLLYLPVLAAFWHAPALLHWHGVSPVKSLFFSLMACWANKGAMLVFMAAWLVVILLAGLVISLIGGLLGGAAALQVIMYPLVLLLAAMFHTSLYFTFRDSFDNAEPAQTTPGEQA
ncbi:MAG: hypothetical protein C0443_08720 [Comamonadaceae bacterium]|nr:hypothetical protein [Comamonadaceae bacterium]